MHRKNFDLQSSKKGNFLNKSKKIMAKKIYKQIINILADNFCCYVALLRKIKQAQQRSLHDSNEEILRMHWNIGSMIQQS